jgi:hypothetical protein
MSNREDDQAFESLSDLLGVEEDLDAVRPDLFETVAVDAVDSSQARSSVGFDVEAFDRSRALVLLGKSTGGICLQQVREFAIEAHAGQRLRHTSEPYWKHLSEVAGLVATCNNSGSRMVALAWLHDVVEDTTVTLREVERTFGASIADGVRCLTGSANSSISSEERSRRDRQRLAAGDTDVHSVKLAEIACRLSSLCRLNSEAELAGYLEEKRLEVGVLTQGDDGLKRLVRTLWSEAKRMAGSSKV